MWWFIARSLACHRSFFAAEWWTHFNSDFVCQSLDHPSCLLYDSVKLPGRVSGVWLGFSDVKSHWTFLPWQHWFLWRWVRRRWWRRRKRRMMMKESRRRRRDGREGGSVGRRCGGGEGGGRVGGKQWTQHWCQKCGKVGRGKFWRKGGFWRSKVVEVEEVCQRTLVWVLEKAVNNFVVFCWNLCCSRTHKWPWHPRSLLCSAPVTYTHALRQTDSRH